jgi:fused signal recognition particle receptor
VIELIIIIVIAVAVVALATASVTLTRSRRRQRGAAPAETRPKPATPPPKGETGTATLEPEARPARPSAREVAEPEVAEAEPGVAEPEVAEPEAEVAEAEVAEAEAQVAEPEVAIAPPTYRSRLGNVRGLFSRPVAALRAGRIDQSTWDSLEEALIRADVGVTTAEALLADLRAKVADKKVSGGDGMLGALGDSIRQLLDTSGPRTLRIDGKPGTPDVWLIVGVNGVGKTTTIGKLARRESAAGRSVLLAAGDTFRAAAADQLSLWADRTGTEIVRGAEGGDPSAIVFDAIQRAAARGNELVLADTAGRLHTKVNLVEELKKIRRIAGRDPGNVTEVLLVLDATTGQNALAQARQFTDAVEVTGIVLTKLDGTAKGGIVIAVQRELGLPVKLVGLGEGPDDLVDFDPDEFVDALLAVGE